MPRKAPRTATAAISLQLPADESAPGEGSRREARLDRILNAKWALSRDAVTASHLALALAIALRAVEDATIERPRTHEEHELKYSGLLALREDDLIHGILEQVGAYHLVRLAGGA